MSLPPPKWLTPDRILIGWGIATFLILLSIPVLSLFGVIR